MSGQDLPGYYSTHPEKAKEYALLRDTKSADPEISQSAKKQLLHLNDKYLRSFVGQWNVRETSGMDFEDALQDAREIFLKVVDKYDLESGKSLRTLLGLHLLGRRKEVLRDKQFYESHKRNTPEIAYNPLDDLQPYDLTKIIESAIRAVLTRDEQDVVRMRFFDGSKQRAIAQIRGCSEARISAIITNAIKKLKNYLLKNGVTPVLFELN